LLSKDESDQLDVYRLSEGEIADACARLGVTSGFLRALGAVTEALTAVSSAFVAEHPHQPAELESRLTEQLPKRLRGAKPIGSFLLHTALLHNPAGDPCKVLWRDEVAQPKIDALNDEVRSDLEGMHLAARPNRHIMDLLAEPSLAGDLLSQIEVIVSNWADVLPPDVLDEVLRAGDFLKEEVPRLPPGPPSDEPQAPGPVFYPGDEAAFSNDRDWMPEVVIVAKNALVWLDQLTKHHGRPIRRLDEIPDEALDQLAQWGFTGLWLIGVWERSQASQTIKRHMGNPEAEASAYSIYEHQIAERLGGEPALERLKWRAGERGIRLAADMVPNHTAIDSSWVMEHPDRFIQCADPPFPGYSFNGPNLSSDESVEIQLEDGYWNHSDAAVVFKRRNAETGEVRYLYHGNDGTNMPWNDTAQLNYRSQHVRDAVVETILEIAARFPIIRFDAAMTLTRQHFQRLWFPAPGTGGDIPSRAAYGEPLESFAEKMPIDFWRSVVDEVASKAPDTLLLAEAFWLTESYFVRKLGMHRVYNSAFMNMLKGEKNVEYQRYMAEILAYDPEVMRRYVNFMSNPDEDTAIAQFGSEDKYFAVATMMVTMPGLPMFAHGQVEGFTEKYGMEYPKAYMDEKPNAPLIERHEREIEPLLRSRDLFAGVQHFALYASDDSAPVLAYSNRCGDQRVLVLVNNQLDSIQGRLIETIPCANFPEKRTLGQALDLEPAQTVNFSDNRTGISRALSRELLDTEGLSFALRGYETSVLVSSG